MRSASRGDDRRESEYIHVYTFLEVLQYEGHRRDLTISGAHIADCVWRGPTGDTSPPVLAPARFSNIVHMSSVPSAFFKHFLRFAQFAVRNAMRPQCAADVDCKKLQTICSFLLRILKTCRILTYFLAYLAL